MVPPAVSLHSSSFAATCPATDVPFSGSHKPGRSSAGGRYKLFSELEEGMSCEIQAIICRKWDAYNMFGTYLSTDYLLSDIKGNVVHCTTKNNVAHCFINKMKEGCVFAFKGFSVIPNLKQYRVVKDSKCMIELHAASIVKRIDEAPPGFTCYVFRLTDIEDVKLDEKNALIDVIGYVIDVGPIVTREVGKGKRLKKATQTLDFYLLSGGGYKIRVTLWGNLATEFLQLKPTWEEL